MRNKVGRNEPCPCGSRRKYKKCCSRKLELGARRRNPLVEWQFGVYASFEELYPGEQNSLEMLRQEMTQFDLDDFLMVVAKVNYLLTGYYNMKDTNELAVLGLMGQDAVFRRAEQLWNQGKGRIITHHQLLALVVENLLLEHTVPARLVDNDLASFKKCIFRMSGFLEKDVLNEDTHGGDVPSDWERTKGALFRNAYLNAQEPFRNLLARYYSVFFDHLPKQAKQYPGEHYDYVKSFEVTTGIRLKVFLLLAVTLWGHYFKRGLKTRLEFLKATPFPVNRAMDRIKPKRRSEALRVFEYLSNDRRGFREAFEQQVENTNGRNYYRLEPIWRWPFFRLTDDAYFPLDLTAFEYKTTLGIKWTVHDAIVERLNHAPEAEKPALRSERNRFMAFYGRTVESYVDDLIRAMFSGMSEVTVLRESGETGGVDFVIYDERRPEEVVFMEFTTSTLHYKTAMSGSTQAIFDELQHILFRDSGRKSKGKVQQLHDSIEAFSKGGLPTLEMVRSRVKRIYPVLVLERNLPMFPGLTGDYRNMIKDKGLLGNNLEFFQMMDLEELEGMEPVVRKGGHRLCELLARKTTDEWRDWPMKNFLIRNRLSMPNKRLNKLSAGIIRDAWDVYKMQDFIAQAITHRVVGPVSDGFRKLWRILLGNPKDE